MEHRFKKIIMVMVVLACMLLTACGKDKPKDTTDSVMTETFYQGQEETRSTEPSETEEQISVPWEAAGAKQPEDYTLDEYDFLTIEQQKKFREHLGAAEYAAWLERVQETKTDEEKSPWEAEGAKQPEDYTIEEYERLTAEQQKLFREYLGTSGYAAWLERAEKEEKTETGPNPWEVLGAKQPQDYTMNEYESLTEKQKKAFMQHLGPNGLEAWLKKVQNQKEQNPWEVADAKKPQDYTWAEYTALTSKQQSAFQSYLGTDGFNAWRNKIQPPVYQEVYPWEKTGAKKPQDYTLEEYQALTAKQQNAFQNYLGREGYAAWLEKFQEEEESYPWETNGAKQPQDYTMAEYEALTESQKKAFQENLGVGGFEDWLEKDLQPDEYPWEADGAKLPKDYTWAEYEALTEAQRAAFQDHLGAESFETWLEEAADAPWGKADAKQPDEYTLEEYNALTKSQKLAFRTHLGAEGFDTWLAEVQSPKKEYPWEADGAKQPADYTWEEFDNLTADQQMAFQTHLGAEGFEEWLNRVQSQPEPEEKYPWDAAGAKQPEKYTWEEFEALTAAQQMAFQSHLGTKSFEEWLNRVQSQPEPEEKYPWDVAGAKQPEEYTWEEFEALSADQQTAFQSHLGTQGFEEWLNHVQSQPQPEENPWNEPGAKQPADYTWEEFEALTAAQQMAFQKNLGEGGFEEWLNRVQSQPEINPWDEPGAKQPADYTWEEFEDLTAAQQIAFQNDLGVEEFEAWLNRVLTEENS